MRDAEPTASTSTVGGYPANTLLWLSIAAIVAAVVLRLGFSLQRRLHGGPAH